MSAQQGPLTPSHSNAATKAEQLLAGAPEWDNPFEGEADTMSVASAEEKLDPPIPVIPWELSDPTSILNWRLKLPFMHGAFPVHLGIKHIEPPWLRNKNRLFDTVLARFDELMHVSPAMSWLMLLDSIKRKLDTTKVLTAQRAEAGDRAAFYIWAERNELGLLRNKKSKINANRENWPDVVAALDQRQVECLKMRVWINPGKGLKEGSEDQGKA